MTNDEILMTNEFLKPNDEGKRCVVFGIICAFVIRHSFDIRHSDFVIVPRHDSNAERGTRNAECGVPNQATDNGRLTTDHEP